MKRALRSRDKEVMRAVNKLVNGGRGVGTTPKSAGAAPMLASLFAARFFCFDRQSVETGSRVVCGLSNERERSVVNGVINRVFRRPTPRGRRNPAVCNPVRNAERRSRSYHGSGDGKWAQGGLRAVGNRQPSPGPPRTRQYHSMVVEEAVEVCVSNVAGLGLSGGWFVPFSFGAG